jgi:hypothetical protein
MSEKIVQDFIKAVTDTYQGAGMPEGLPEGFSIVQKSRRGDKIRPLIEIGSEDEKWMHPKLVQFDLVMGLETRSEDVEEDEEVAADVVAGWFAAIEETFLDHISDTLEGIDALGFRVRHLYPVSSGTADPEGDGYTAMKRWKVILQKN